MKSIKSLKKTRGINRYSQPSSDPSDLRIEPKDLNPYLHTNKKGHLSVTFSIFFVAGAGLATLMLRFSPLRSESNPLG